VLGEINKRVAAGNGKICTWRRDDALDADATVTAKLRAWSDSNPPPVMVQDLYTPSVVNYYQSLEQVPGDIKDTVYKVSKMAFVRIPAKGVTYKMGSPVSEAGRTAGEYEHEVSLTNDFYLAVYPMTQGQAIPIIEYDRFMANGYGMSAQDTKSSYGMSEGEDWFLTPIDFMSKRKIINIYSIPYDNPYKQEQGMLWKYHQLTGVHAYVPTEAEWEFACRAGRSGPLNADGNIDDIAWHSGNSGGRLQPVGLKKPNGWGLYDMLGNVWECCHDSWRDGLDNTAVTSPVYFAGNWTCVSRGGAFNEDASLARSASRHSGGGKLAEDFTGEGCKAEGLRLKIPIFN
jgi:formylglycine-generating enzyme required for sulfatase activity